MDNIKVEMVHKVGVILPVVVTILDGLDMVETFYLHDCQIRMTWMSSYTAQYRL